MDAEWKLGKGKSPPPARMRCAARRNVFLHCNFKLHKGKNYLLFLLQNTW